MPATKANDADEPPVKKKHCTSTIINDSPHLSTSSGAKAKHQPFAIVIPAPKQTASYAIPPSHWEDTSATTPLRVVLIEHHTQPMPPSALTPEWLLPTATLGIPKLLMRVDAMTDRQDLILAWVNDLERQMMALGTCTPAPTPGLVDNWIHILETKLAKFQWTVGTLMWEIEALRVKVQGTMDAEAEDLTRLHMADLLDLSSPCYEGCSDHFLNANMPESQGTAVEPAEEQIVAVTPSQSLEVTATVAMEVGTSNTEGCAWLEAGDGTITMDQGTWEVRVVADVHMGDNGGGSTIADMEVADT
ncbi:hypothetical protein PISMIDRAFT_25147 [Pisolithus microcarpus 441]|uniref:Uncharacterized protein n=1 Tax=Pisolithus microcarpus 441 TaxID=765257 RepID=A0A0C9Z1G3_9AGAM|nr:hypothetical protein BKA83DRAFT_25147 [Pisolithus microcarpus]KIK16132.1 hypothetical protein PISMIDRAFT_25147 [Pisolithus microcarpus 441]